jgi:hypothetical protein
MKKLLLTFFAFLLFFQLYGQENVIIADLDDDFVNIDTIAPPQKFKSIHMLGVRYGYSFCTVSSSPTVGEEYLFCPMNFSLLYTYYHALWNQLFNFGVQFGVKYGEEGYASKYEQWGERYKIIEVPLVSQFKIDFSRFRFLVNAGGYYGYRLSTARESGWDRYDLRHDYGILAGAGLAVVFKPFEIQIEGNYKYSLCSIYHTNKFSDEYWMLCYPRNIMLSVGLFVHLW